MINLILHWIENITSPCNTNTKHKLFWTLPHAFEICSLLSHISGSNHGRPGWLANLSCWENYWNWNCEIQWMLHKTVWENMDVIGKSSYISFQFLLGITQFRVLGLTGNKMEATIVIFCQFWDDFTFGNTCVFLHYSRVEWVTFPLWLLLLFRTPRVSLVLRVEIWELSYISIMFAPTLQGPRGLRGLRRCCRWSWTEGRGQQIAPGKM